MGYLSEYEHDIFVSYAHSELNDWCRRLVKDIRKHLTYGLSLREATQVDLWMDYKVAGNQPLTGQLKQKVERSGILLVLMSEWYLESSWCRDELEWFVNTIQQKRNAHPVFIVRVRATDHADWPPMFKDEHGHPLAGYDFVRDTEDNALGLPKGHPNPDKAEDEAAYYQAVSKLAADMVRQLRQLATPPNAKPPTRRLSNEMQEGAATPLHQRVFLAAATEDVEVLREQLAVQLQARGCIVLPETNPRDGNEMHQHADGIANCDKFVQVLGTLSGTWRHDSTGFVIYQHELAKKAGKPMFVYRSPSLDIAGVNRRQYRDFIEHFSQDDVGDLTSFAERVTRVVAPSPRVGAGCLFMMKPHPRDESLEREVRRLLEDLNIRVFPLARCGSSGREVVNVLDEGLLTIIRRCGAILLINGNAKEEQWSWIDQRLLEVEQDIQHKFGGHPPCAILDAPPDPRLESRKDLRVFPWDSPNLKSDLQGWLHTLQAGAAPVAGGLA